MAKRIWEFQSLSQISDDTKFLVSQGENTRVVPGSLINQINARIDSIVAGSATEVSAAEIADARVRSDGQTAASLGAAIRWIYETLTAYSYESYSDFDFSGGVISSGWVKVCKKGGWCQVWGEIVPTDKISDWTEILDNSCVPAPQHAKECWVASTNWRDDYCARPRILIASNGGLRVRYGSNHTFDFCVTYPIA